MRCVCGRAVAQQPDSPDLLADNGRDLYRNDRSADAYFLISQAADRGSLTGVVLMGVLSNVGRGHGWPLCVPWRRGSAATRPDENNNIGPVAHSPSGETNRMNWRF